MLNFYYVYAATWGTILFLYLLGWSSLNAALNPVLLFFFLVTIILSLVLGMRWKKRFVYREIAPSKLPVWAIALILGCGVIGYAQLGFVPIANILNGTYVYQDMLDADASIFRTIGLVGSEFGCGYQFVRILQFRQKSDFVKLGLFLLYLVSFGSRGPLVICILTCSIVYVSHRRIRLTPLRALVAFFLIVIVLWLFGILGNMRQGYDWDDCSYIYLLGYYEGLWPDFMPKEFCWAYSYLTSPLANLNYSLNTAIQVDPVNFCYDFLPMMLSKRLPLYEVVEPPLQVPYFNVSSVWSNYYMHLDLMGLFLGYLLQVCMLEVWIKLARGSEHEGLMMAYCSQCVILSFFVNSFAYPTMGYPAILLACICIWKRSSKRKSYARAAPLCLCRHV